MGYTYNKCINDYFVKYLFNNAKFLYMKAIYILLRLYSIDAFCIQLYKCKYYEFCINDTKNAFLKAIKAFTIMHFSPSPIFFFFETFYYYFAKLLLRVIGDNDLVRDSGF